MKISKKILKISSILGVSALSVSAGVVPFLQTSAKSAINANALSAQKSSINYTRLSPEDIGDNIFSRKKDEFKKASGYSIATQISDAKDAIYEWVLDGKAYDSKIWDKGEMIYEQDWSARVKNPSENMDNLDAFTNFFQLAKIELPKTSKDIKYDYKIFISHSSAPEYRIKYQIHIRVWGESETGEIIEKMVRFNIKDKSIPDHRQISKAAGNLSYAKWILKNRLTTKKHLTPSEFVKSVGDKATGKNLTTGYDIGLNDLLGVKNIHFESSYYLNNVKLDYEFIPKDEVGEVWVKIKLYAGSEYKEETLRILGFGIKGIALYKMSEMHGFIQWRSNMGGGTRKRDSKIKIPELLKSVPREGKGFKDLKDLVSLFNIYDIKVDPWSEETQIVFDYKIDDSMYEDYGYVIANITMRSLVDPSAIFKSTIKIYEAPPLTVKDAYAGLVELYKWFNKGDNAVTKFKDKTLAEILGQKGVETEGVGLDYMSRLFGIKKIKLDPKKAKKFLKYYVYVSVPWKPETKSEIAVTINVQSPGVGYAALFVIKGFKYIS